MSKALEDELAWERRARQLLQSIALAAAESGSWHDTMQHAVREICVATGWPVGHALVRGDNGDLGSSRIWHLEDEERFHVLREVTEATRFGAGRGLPGRVLMTGRPLWIGDVTLDDNFPRAALAGDLGVRAAFALPVLVKEQRLDGLEAESPLAAEPQRPLLDVMAAIGAQLGRVVERGLADEALRQSELRFRSVAQTAHDAIISADATGRIISWNRGASVMFGYTEDEALSRPLTMVIPERLRARHEEGLRRVGSGGAQRVIGRTVELEGLRRDGNEFPLELSLAAWQIGEASYYTGILRDITERKENEQRLHTVATRLERSEKAAIEANRAKSIFLANMSHELRTPLNAILGFVQLLRRDRTLNVGQRENVDVIARSGEHLLGLINDVLTISKIEAGETILNPTHFDPGRLLRGLRELFHLRAEARGLELRFEISAAFPSLVTGDEGKLRQVLINLLANAVKFTETGSITVRSTWVRGQASFAVDDTGPGIAPADVERLFAPFVQTAAGLKAHEGTGLGLAISHDFVRLMGGELRVETTLGEGTCFSFAVELPAAIAARDEGRADPPVVGVAPGQRDFRILVVDNAPDNRRLLASLLASVGLSVREAADGRAALAGWEAWRPDIIWMDMRMPVMNGYEATVAIRALEAAQGGKRTVIVALTASAFDHDRAAILAAGCDAVVAKPFQEATIFDVLTKHVGIQFVREGAPAAPLPPIDGAPVLSPLRLGALPADWRAELGRALAEGDDLQAQRTVDRIVDVDAPLARELRELVKAFQFDELLGLLERIPA